MFKFLFVGETCKLQTHIAPSVEVAFELVIQTSLNKSFLNFSLEVNVTVVIEFLEISGKKKNQ